MYNYMIRFSDLRLILILIFTFAFLNGNSQSDSTRQKLYFDGLLSEKYSAEASVNNADSFLLNTLFFDPVRRSTPFSVVTGNPGSAHLDIIKDAFRSSVLNDGFSHFDGYMLSPFKQLPGKAVPSRYTLIDYHLASKREQHIMINHEQHIKKWWFAGIDFGAMSSPGDFSRQLNTNRNFRIWNSYEAPKGSYRSYLSFSSNKINNQENGGITSDSIFENASSLDTRTLPVFLRNAESTLKTRNLFLKQEIVLLGLFAPYDSLHKKKAFASGDFVLSHSAHYNRKSFLFESVDPDSGYFTDFLIDSLETRDSVFFGQFMNEFLLSYHSDSGKFNYYFGGGVLIENNTYYYTGSDSSFNRWRSVVKAGWNAGKVFSTVKGSFHLGGDFGDTWDLSADFHFILLKDKLNAILGGSSGKYAHSLKDYLYQSNHFKWSNDFDLLEQTSLFAGLYLPHWRTHLIINGFIEKNRVFYREDFIPQTYDNPVTFGKVSLVNQLKAGKFSLDNRLEGAWSGNENVVRLPSFSLYSACYYSDVFFKRALGFKAGVDFNYHTAYYSYGYMPATGIFYLQDIKKTGNYPLVSAFVNLQIKTASLFIRVDHLNAGMGSRTYYGAYGYPLQGRTLKFGVNWTLID
jgi:hypothetical protein